MGVSTSWTNSMWLDVLRLPETFSRKLYLLGLFDAAACFHHVNKATSQYLSPPVLIFTSLQEKIETVIHLFVSATSALTGPKLTKNTPYDLCRMSVESTDKSHGKGF